jgi:hypothetical protein
LDVEVLEAVLEEHKEEGIMEANVLDVGATGEADSKEGVKDSGNKDKDGWETKNRGGKEEK